MAVRFIVLGGLSIDTVYFPGETEPRVLCGGNALYGAIGAAIWARRPAEVGIAGSVGTTFPPPWLEALRGTGIDLTGVRETGEEHALTFRATYDDDGYRHVDVSRSLPRRHRARALPLMERLPVAYLGAEAAQCCQYGLKMQREHTRFLHRQGLRVFLDPSEEQSAGLSQRGVREFVRSLDVFLPSEMEVPDFVTQDQSLEPEGVARILAGFGPQVVVIKLGARGSVVYDRAWNAAQRVGAYPTRAIDPTGAGDAFVGGFMVAYIETGDAFEAALWATVAASLVVERAGALAALHDLAQLRDQAPIRLQYLRRLNHATVFTGGMGAAK